MAITIYLRSTATHVGALGSHGNNDIETTTATTATLSIGANTPRTFVFYSSTSFPNLLDWQTGDYTYNIDVSTANANVQLTSLKISRYDSSLTTEKASGTATPNLTLSTTGLKTGTISFASPNPAGTKAVDDRLVLTITITKLAGGGTQSAVIDLNGASDSRIDTPLTVPVIRNISETSVSVSESLITQELYIKPISESAISVDAGSIEVEKISTNALYDVHFVEFPEDVTDSVFVPPPVAIEPISTTKTHKYDIIGKITRTRTHKYNIVGKLTTTKTHKYHILNQITTVIKTHKYNIIGKLTTSKTHKYNVLRTITPPAAKVHLFNIIAKIVRTRTHKYNVLNVISPPTIKTHKFTLLNQITRTHTHKYNIISKLTTTKTHKYNLESALTHITRNRTHKFHIEGRVLQTKTHKYSIISRIPQVTKTHKYNIIQKIQTVTKTHKYSIIAKILKTKTHKYNVLKQISPYAAKVHLYNIIARVLQTKTHKYNVSSAIVQVTRTHTHKYNIIGRVLQTKTHKFNIQLATTHVTRNTTHVYTVLKRIASTLTHKYSIIAKTLRNKTHKYNIIATIQRTRTHKFNIIQKITTKTTTYKYNILNRVTPDRTRTHKFSIIALALKTKTHKYNIIGRIYRTKTHKYHLGGKVVSTHRHRYEVGSAIGLQELGGSTQAYIKFPERIRIIDIIADINNLALANIEVRPDQQNIIVIGHVAIAEYSSRILTASAYKPRHRIATTLITPQVIDTIDNLAVAPHIGIERIEPDPKHITILSQIQLHQSEILNLLGHTQLKQDLNTIINIVSNTILKETPLTRIASKAQLEMIPLLKPPIIMAPEIMTREKHKLLQIMVKLLSIDDLFS